MPKKATKKLNGAGISLRFDQRLVLNRWLLSLFEVDSFEALARHLKDPALETLDENNVSRFYTELTLR